MTVEEASQELGISINTLINNFKRTQQNCKNKHIILTRINKNGINEYFIEKEKMPDNVYTKEEFKIKFNITDNMLEHFQKTQKSLKNKGILVTKTGIGEKALYTIIKILDTPNKINNGLKINGIQYPEIELGTAKNLKGQRFERLVPLYRTINDKNKNAQWVCQCDCGIKTIVSANKLLSGNTRSCGCLQKEHSWHGSNFKDLTNQRFGKLTVIKYIETNKRGSRWLCQCDCGKLKEVQSAELYSGDTTSCGCRYKTSYGEETIEKILNQNNINYKKEYSFKDLKGKSEMFPLRFDFAIFDNENNLSYLIEYDGEQHFKEIDSQVWGVAILI